MDQLKWRYQVGRDCQYHQSQEHVEREHVHATIWPPPFPQVEDKVVDYMDVAGIFLEIFGNQDVLMSESANARSNNRAHPWICFG